MTPALHRMHHSDQPAETDTNYGHDFAVWDRLFGTYLDPRDQEDGPAQYGLTRFPPDRASDLNALLSAPFRKGPFS